MSNNKLINAALLPRERQGDAMTTDMGTKYQREMDVAEVAKRVRADIKAAQKAGTLPTGMKATVNIHRYSMGCALYVRVTQAPIQIHASDFIAHQVRTDGQHWEGERFTKSARDLLEKLEALAGAYQRVERGVDSAQNNFHLGVSFGTEVREEDREILTSYYSALPAPAAGPHLRLVG